MQMSDEFYAPVGTNTSKMKIDVQCDILAAVSESGSSTMGIS